MRAFPNQYYKKVAKLTKYTVGREEVSISYQFDEFRVQVLVLQ